MPFFFIKNTLVVWGGTGDILAMGVGPNKDEQLGIAFLPYPGDDPDAYAGKKMPEAEFQAFIEGKGTLDLEPPVVMIFENTASVDVFANGLKLIRETLEKREQAALDALMGKDDGPR